MSRVPTVLKEPREGLSPGTYYLFSGGGYGTVSHTGHIFYGDDPPQQTPYPEGENIGRFVNKCLTDSNTAGFGIMMMGEEIFKQLEKRGEFEYNEEGKPILYRRNTNKRRVWHVLFKQ